MNLSVACPCAQCLPLMGRLCGAHAGCFSCAAPFVSAKSIYGQSLTEPHVRNVQAERRACAGRGDAPAQRQRRLRVHGLQLRIALIVTRLRMRRLSDAPATDEVMRLRGAVLNVGCGVYVWGFSH